MNSPTLSMHATQAGIILGTAAYMSPEQARGKAVDRRADIWAFGCVLFEMLTGARAFPGDDVTDTIVSVVSKEPDWSALPSSVPAGIRRLLRRSLEKDPKRRLDSAAGARIEIDDALSPPHFDRCAVAPTQGHQTWRGLWRLALASAASAIVAGGVVWLFGPSRAAGEPRRVLHFAVTVPANARPTYGGGAQIAVSPDGRSLVYGGASQLYRRDLDGFVVEPIRGAEGGRNPTFSPDGRSLVFFADGKLKKIPVAGGLSVTICTANGGSASWGDDDSIVYTDNSRLFRVSATGGTPAPIAGSEARPGEAILGPQVVPGARAVLFSAGGKVQALSFGTGRRTTVGDGLYPQFVRPGYLVFTKDGSLWVAPFNPQTLTVTGAAVPAIERVRSAGSGSAAAVAINGTLAYVPGLQGAPARVVSLDRSGRATSLLDARAEYSDPHLSPDGHRLAMVVPPDVWVYDLDRGTRLRLTTAGLNRRPRWSPDGAKIAFQSGPTNQQMDVFWRAADGTGNSEPLVTRPGTQFPDAWSPDGRALIFNEGTGPNRDLWVLPLGQEPKPWLATPFNERTGAISPDGRWLSYVSDESGRDEVYVRPYPGSGAAIAVSANGGTQSVWSRDGRELFYREGDTLMAVPIQGQPFKLGAPARLFPLERSIYGEDSNSPDYDIFPDGTRFVAVRHEGQTAADEIRVVLDWTDELARLLRQK